jgi:hypothetical protein
MKNWYNSGLKVFYWIINSNDSLTHNFGHTYLSNPYILHQQKGTEG